MWFQVSPRVTERYFLDPQRFRAELNEYKRYVKNMVELAGAGNESVAFANEIFEFSTRLARTMDTSEERRNGSYLFHEVTIGELQQLTDPHAQQVTRVSMIDMFLFESSV